MLAAGGVPLPDYNNAGQLTGVSVIYEPHAYIAFNREWRNIDWILGGAARAADFNVYWGAGGKVDSVVDITHNVVVPFLPTMGGNWGILTECQQHRRECLRRSYGRSDGHGHRLRRAVEVDFLARVHGSPATLWRRCRPTSSDSIATLGTIAFIE